MPMEPEAGLKAYRDALTIAWQYNDYRDWPVRMTAAMHLFCDRFAAEFMADLEALSLAGYDDLAIARAFGSPVRLTRIADSVLFGLKRLRTTLDDQRQMILRLMEMAQRLKYGSPFNEDGRNLIWSPAAAAAHAAATPFRRVVGGEAGAVQRLCGALFAYTESIFFRAHDITKEFHGLYPLEGGEQLLIREYRSLRPHEIWPDAPLLPCSTVRVSTIYGPGLQLDIDFYNHLYLRQGNYLGDLRRYAVEVDGRLLPPDEIPGLMEQIAGTVSYITRQIDPAPWQDRVEKYAEIFWFRKRPLQDLRGVDWRVPAAVRERIRTGELFEPRMKLLDREQIARLIHMTV